VKRRFFSFLVVFFLTLIIQACGGGGGGNGGLGISGLPSGSVPYLLGPVQVTWEANTDIGTGYDVTVSLQADGPAGVMFASLWIYENGGSGDFRSLDLINTGGNTWQATTSSFLPMSSGNYHIDSIMLEDQDTFASPPVMVGSGWYFINEAISSARFTLDERIIDYADITPPWIHYELGLSNIDITTFTLP